MTDLSKSEKRADFTNLRAPQNFSLINNTEAMLKYLHDGKKLVNEKRKIYLDIQFVKRLTADSIAVMACTITNPLWSKKTIIQGNAPKDIHLRRLFIESGFYNYVKSKVPYISNDRNLMHKETSKKVQPLVVKNAIATISKNVVLNDEESEAIYNVLVELMSNTLHHADLSNYGVSNWWLYVCSDVNRNTSVTFIDLGVGIFKSALVKNYARKIGRELGIVRNVDIVPDLLKGKIGSRIEIDKTIRGRGIPQIVESSALSCFRNFYIIANDVKIDLKTGVYSHLENKFRGTFIYFELYKTNDDTSNGNSR